jgi:hypothetical protein
VEAQPAEAETTDPSGARIILALALWRDKIVRGHPEIAAHLSDVLRAVSKPDHVAPDPSHEARTRYYAGGVGPKLVAVGRRKL